MLVVDVAFIIANIVTFLITKNKEKIALSGKEYTAEFVAYKSNLSVNNLKLYNIVYTWVDEKGQQKKDTSGHQYTFFQAHAFEELGKFKIRVKDNESVIVTDPTKERDAKHQTIEIEKNYNTCKYCNSIFAKDKQNCPNCGASIQERK